jgi:hypothetical protein
MSIVRVVSATLCAILAGAYLILPKQRKHPHIIVLLLAILMVPFDAFGAMWLQYREKLLCKNVFEVSTISNSWYCGVQGKRH